jgi:hypothetical protein
MAASLGILVVDVEGKLELDLFEFAMLYGRGGSVDGRKI